MIKQANNGQFQIPAEPSAGQAAVQSTSAGVYGSYAQLIASTANAIFITGLRFSTSTTSALPTYLNVRIGTGAAASEVTVGDVDCAISNVITMSGLTGQSIGGFIPINPPIPVPAGTRIAVKTASNLASAQSWPISLTCINQADCVDAGVNEHADAYAINGISTASVTTVNANVGTTQPQNFTGTGANAALIVDAQNLLRQRNTAQAGTANSITLDAGASSLAGFYNGGRVVLLAGNGAGQEAIVTAYDGTTKIASVTPPFTGGSPNNTTVFVISGGAADVVSWRSAKVNAAVAGYPQVDAAYWNGVLMSDAEPPSGTNLVATLTGQTNTLSTLTTGGNTFVKADMEAIAGNTNAVGLTGNLLNVSSAGGTGNGAFAISLAVTDGTNIIGNATAQMIGSNVLGKATTDSGGLVTLGQDAGVSRIIVAKGGYVSYSGTQLISGNLLGTNALAIVLPPLVIPAATNAGQVNGTLYCYDSRGNPTIANCEFEMLLTLNGSPGGSFSRAIFTGTSVANTGLMIETFEQNSRYRGRRLDANGDHGAWAPFNTPTNNATFALPQILGLCGAT